MEPPRPGGRRPAQLAGHLQPGRERRIGEAHVLERPGQPGQQQDFGLGPVQPGQPGAVAVEQPVAARVPGVPVQRDPGGGQGLDVPVDGPDGDLQFLGELPGGHPAPVLEQEQQGDESARAHGAEYPRLH